MIALTRLLDPASARVQPTLADIRQQEVRAENGAGDSRTAPEGKAADETKRAGPGGDSFPDPGARTRVGAPTVAPCAEVEVTLIRLDSELEQLCDGFLEPLDAYGQVDETGSAGADAALGVRLAYRVSYDPLTDALEHVTFFPARSNVSIGQYPRVPTAVRRAMPVVFVSKARPLQLRSEGVLRRLVTDRDADAVAGAFRALEQAVAAATDALSADPAIAATLDAVLRAGGLARHLADSPLEAGDVHFRPEDGSLSALLRAVQPALALDEAGLLTMSSHGSTAAAILAGAEAVLLAASVDGAIVLGDDFGDGLDAATAEHFAAVLRAHADQLWLTTRRPEVARAFSPGELVRLSRGPTGRSIHLVPEPKDKKQVALRRLLHAQLLPAVTARAVAITEGPHDLTTYAGADRHRAAASLPLSAAGVRLVCADNGSGGGTGEIPRVADLARALGFRVIALIDGDREKTAGGLAAIEATCDVVVRLPTSVAIEATLTTGVDMQALRAASAIMPAYGLPDPADGLADDGVATAVVALLHKKGLHEQFLDTLVDEIGMLPPLLDAALGAVAVAANINYAGPARIDVTPTASATTAITDRQ